MVITFTLRSGEVKQRKIEPGYQLTGARLDSITIESVRELDYLSTERGQKWLQNHVVHALKNKE